MLRKAPKDPGQNLKYRRSILERAIGDMDFRREVWIRCARDPIYYIDTFGWIYCPKDHPSCPDQPFILYPYQEEAVLKLKAAFGKHDLLIEKSRDVGATWIVTAATEHESHFVKRQSFLYGSRKQEYVWKRGDPKTLFWKLLYFIENLPGWMQPRVEDAELTLQFQDNGSTINGESTNDDFARGDRRTAIFLDEFPAVDNGYQILTATRDATNCRLFVGTPQGAAGAFYDTRQKMLATTPERIIRLHWTSHPEKRKGLYSIEGCDEGKQPTILDKEYKFPPGFNFLDVRYPQFKTRSIWFNEQCVRAANAQELAQEVEIDYAQSGFQFFEQPDVEKWTRQYAIPPFHRGEMLLKPDWKHPEWFEHKKGTVQLWFNPDMDGKPPKEWTDITCGCDIATGKAGEMSSNSVASFVRASTGEKVAQFVTNSTFPSEFAKVVMGMCAWLNDAFLIFESNGPGGEFGKQVKDSGYRKVYMRYDDETKFVQKKTRQPGWWSDKDKKKILLADYRNALMTGKFVNRSEEALKECSQYVHYPGGKVEHSRSQSTSDPTATGENHGDHVIADALANRGISELERMQIEEKDTPQEPPPGSFGARRNAYVNAHRHQKRVWGEFARSS